MEWKVQTLRQVISVYNEGHEKGESTETISCDPEVKTPHKAKTFSKKVWKFSTFYQKDATYNEQQNIIIIKCTGDQQE